MMTTAGSVWRKNLNIAWLGCFLTGASFSLVMPFMALFIRSIGVRGAAVEFYAGLSVSINALAAALVAPIWGRLADRYGRKPMMVRASFVMTFTMGAIAFVHQVEWLIVLRLLNGLFAGYVPNATALIASQTPKKEAGKALGMLATGAIGGSLVGPLLGGFLAQIFGMRNVFLLVGGMLLLASVLTVCYISEDFEPVSKADSPSIRELFHRSKDAKVMVGLFVTSMIMQISAQSIAPILPLYIEHLGQTENVMFIAGLIVSAMGFSSMMSSVWLGRLGDRIGNHRMILLGLTYCGIIYLILAQATTPLQLGIWRFLFGFGTGALMPSINALLTKITPSEGISTIFSFNQTFVNLGQVVGPFVGSSVATGLGYQWVFYVTAAIVFFNLAWSLVNFRKYIAVRDIE